jgi:adenylosuccinate synthase
MSRKMVVVQGMQFGSEAKGSIAGLIGSVWQPDTAVCANHPNAGHTFINSAGVKFVHRILPVAAACPSVKKVLIGPGAVISATALQDELNFLQDTGFWAKDKILLVHPNACFVNDAHMEAEKRLVKIGSTMKGSAEAVIHRCVGHRNRLAPIWYVSTGRYWKTSPISREF